MAESDRAWSAAERKEVLSLAVLPAVGAAILTLALFFSQPRMWLFVFFIAAVGSYVTSFLGVMPVLFWFRRCGWVHWLHFALAGFVGVLVPWLLVGFVLGLTPGASLSSGPSLVLVLAAFIGGTMSAVFGLLRRRKAFS
jgi:hypothetical protein